MARAEPLHQASDSISRQSERRPEMWLAPSSNAAEDFAASETTLRVHAKAGRSRNLFPSEAGTFLPTPCRAATRKSRRAPFHRRTCAGCRTHASPNRRRHNHSRAQHAAVRERGLKKLAQRHLKLRFAAGSHAAGYRNVNGHQRPRLVAFCRFKVERSGKLRARESWSAALHLSASVPNRLRLDLSRWLPPTSFAQ